MRNMPGVEDPFLWIPFLIKRYPIHEFFFQIVSLLRIERQYQMASPKLPSQESGNLGYLLPSLKFDMNVFTLTCYWNSKLYTHSILGHLRGGGEQRTE